jgi:hypothetical protein
MNSVNIKELAMRVREFVEQAAPKIACVIVKQGVPLELDEGGIPIITYLESDIMLDTWMRLPDGPFSPMFIGWCIARGINVDEFTYSDVIRAAYYAANDRFIEDVHVDEGCHGPH